MVLVGNCPRDNSPLVGNSWALFLSDGELSPVGVVLDPAMDRQSTKLLCFTTGLYAIIVHNYIRC